MQPAIDRTERALRVFEVEDKKLVDAKYTPHNQWPKPHEPSPDDHFCLTKTYLLFGVGLGTREQLHYVKFLDEDNKLVKKNNKIIHQYK